MKRTSLLKTLLLIITLSVINFSSSFAAENLVGSLDVFNGTEISGWVHDESGDMSGEIQIKIENCATGELIKSLSTTPSYRRSDLMNRVGENSTPAFTVTVDMSSLPDGNYQATAYKNGRKFTDPIYYAKGSSQVSLNGSTLRPLGTFRLTAYCPCRSCSAGWGSRTSSGTVATAGRTIAVDKRIIPMGSKLLIGGTVYTAEDVGGAVKGNHIDIFFNSHSQAKQFGVRSSEVFLVQ